MYFLLPIVFFVGLFIFMRKARGRLGFFKRLSSIKFLAICILIFVLPLYTYLLLALGTYQDIILSDSWFQSSVVSFFGVRDTWSGVGNSSFEFVGEDEQEFYLAFFTSALDSVLFFSTIGFLTLLIGVRDPKNETIHNRVEYLLSADDIDPSARATAVEEVEKLACYNDTLLVDLVIEDVDATNSVFKISMNYRAKIFNMFRKESYVDEQFKGITQIDTAPPKKKPLGQIRYVRIDNEDKLEKICSIDSVGKYETHPIKIEVAPNQSIEFETYHWLWEEFNKEYFVGVSRYTRKLVLRVSNSSNEEGIKVKAISQSEPQIDRNYKSLEDWKDVSTSNEVIFEGPLKRNQAAKLEFMMSSS